ncbi:MAG: choice-of-anchor B family protein [Thermoanaerobaculia bacterium]
MMPRTLVSSALGLLLLATTALSAQSIAVDPDEGGRLTETMQRLLADAAPPEDLAPEHLTECVGNMAGVYPCQNVDLLELIPLATMGATAGNDSWGWTDPKSGREFALMGLNNGTAFVEITDPENSVYLGKLPTHTSNSSWRDIKTYSHYAFIVSEASNHGMQVFDLEQLLNVVSPPVTFTESAHYPGFGNAHNIVINESSGFAFAVGTSTCSGGPHFVNIQNPLAPVGAGCFSADGYTHDAQCVNYTGPDSGHAGQEVCFNSNEDTLTIVNVSNKAAPVQISRTPYAGSGYTHQGWLTADQHYFLVDDELDEQNFGHNTYTYVWDISDLESPVPVGHFTSPTPAIDHNQYIKGNFTFQANYRSGLRILRLDDLSVPTLTQVGYFDIYPANDSANFSGAWSVYPYFPSGNVIVSGIGEGLFVLRPILCTTPAAPAPLSAGPNGDNQIDLEWVGSGTSGNIFTIERALGGCAGNFETIAEGVTGTSYSDTTASGQVTYGYRVRESDATGFCTSGASTCATASTTGACTAPPLFPGLEAVANDAESICQVELGWPAATPLCGGPARFNVYRDSQELFVPSLANRIATGVAGGAYTDVTAPSGFKSYYIVRAVDEGSAAEDGNLVRRSTTATGPIVDGTFSTGAEIGDPPLDTFVDGALTTGGDAPEHAGWHPVETRQHSGLRSFASGPGDNVCLTLESDLTLTAGQTSTLTFFTVWDIEATFDGGVLRLSTDAGNSWTTVDPGGGFYPNLVTQSGNACQALQAPPSKPAFSSVNQFSWQQKTVSLAAWSGQNVRLAWTYGTDGGVTEEGWYVDDISVTHTQIPASCSNDAIFIERYEGGDFGAWGQVTSAL